MTNDMKSLYAKCFLEQEIQRIDKSLRLNQLTSLEQHNPERILRMYEEDLTSLEKEHRKPPMLHTEYPKIEDGMTDIELRSTLQRIGSATKDALYRILWEDYIREDIIEELHNQERFFTEEQIQICVNRYVYNGDYDCNLSYWENIQNLIDDIK